MSDKILDGKKLADKLNSELKEIIEHNVKRTNIRPKLATILVGNKESANKLVLNLFL
jgi:5,10-methylene-tetrahydrofolate dehydrogenase/methenyl tetrahydrofolate cyclohydrolase